MTYPPQQNPPAWQPPPPRPPSTGRRKLKFAGIGCGGLIVGLLVIGGIGAALDPPKKTAATTPIAATQSAVAITTASSAPTAPPTSAAATTANPTPATPSPTTPSPTPKPKPKPAKAKPKPKPSPTGCGPERDVIVWYVVPTLSDSAQLLGNYNLVTCETTFENIQDTSPTGPGYCTVAAWASDNPGYDANADPAKRPKKAQVEVGPAC